MSEYTAAVRAAARDHSRTSPMARELGQQVARLVAPGIAELAAQGKPDERCRSCAFRAGTVPNGCTQTLLDVVKSVVEHKPFYCHMHLAAGGEPTTVCHGWFAAAHTGRDMPAGTVPWDFSPSDALIEDLTSQGYTDLQQKFMGPLCGLHRFFLTWGLVVGLDAEGYGRRYCFEREADARASLAAWDGTGHPGGPWIKCKGRMDGQAIDLLNPELRT